jgi:opacity protein-like surface antigen
MTPPAMAAGRLNIFTCAASKSGRRLIAATTDATNQQTNLMHMKTRYFAGLAGLMVLSGALTAQAQNYYYYPEGAGPYLRSGIGPAFFENGRISNFGGPANGTVNYQTGVSADVAIGYAFNKYLATDLELGFVGAKIQSAQDYYSDNSYLYEAPFMANFILSCPIPQTLLVPYIGAGVGGSAATFDTDNFSDAPAKNTTVVGRESDVVFAYQAFAGLRFNLNPTMSVGIGYKYFATEGPTFTYPSGYYGGPDFQMGFDGVHTHSVQFTFQWSFW